MKTKTTTLASLLAITLTAAGQTPATGGIKADFNGDGFADLAVGSPSEDYDSGFITTKPIRNAGAVTIIYGSSIGLAPNGADGVPSSTTWHQNTSGVADSCESGDQFGAALTAGDINRDGFSDLVIGIPGERDSAGNPGGAVQVLFGSSAGLTATGNIIIHGSGLKHMFKSGNGTLSLLCADFNGDGFADLVAEAEFGTYPKCEPRLLFLRGSASGLSTTNFQSIALPADIRFTIPGTTSYMCDLTFTAGDFNEDGRADLVVGAPFGSAGNVSMAGHVRVLFGTSTGPSLLGATLIHQDSPGVQEQAAYNDRFGASLAVGDFNGDRRHDLAVGVPFEDNLLSIEENGIVDGGCAHVFLGDGKQVSTAGNQILMESVEVDAERGILDFGPEPYDQNGTALAAGDFDGDGITDLAIGAPGDTVDEYAQFDRGFNQGSVIVFYGSATALGFGDYQFWTEALADPNAVVRDGDRFGASLAAADFGRHYNKLRFTETIVGSSGTLEGVDVIRPCDLVIGIPGKDVGEASNAGAARTIYGYPTGLGISTFGYSPGPFPQSPGASQLFHKNLIEVETDAEYGAELR